MSTALSIASVTHVLMDLLNNGLIDQDITNAIGNVTVTALPPDRIDTTPTNEQSQLNLFMYQTTPNPGWSNVGLPSRDGQGERRNNPPLAIDLHYLLTAYGANDLHTDILLGYGMQLLHETPVLVRDAIRRSLTSAAAGGGLPDALRALATSQLAEQVEQIKITSESLNTEEISKLWTAFQAKFRPSSAYVASVVLIESNHSTKSALPVRARNIYARPFRNPVIEKIMSQATSGGPIIEDLPILAGHNLVITGKNLRSDGQLIIVDGVEVIDGLLVNVSGIEIKPAAVNVTDTQIIIPLTDEDLRAGIQGVQVTHSIPMGTPEVPHQGVESNVKAFVLQPQIIGPVTVNVAAAVEAADTVLLKVKPAVGESQRVILLLNEFDLNPSSSLVSDPPLSYSFKMSPDTDPGPTWPIEDLTFSVSNVLLGTYLVRVQVDGAESPLGIDADGKYNSPTADIP
ncbi:hypothetical protein SCALIN_C05_0235 [Candidatus Scalindua japonica]|uniref:Pvc16 N-terminal domain-containing protein n=1 Tax=Candidatus Scalindua japonica TaxID=1284222 RepID=A0A286TW89_9BACT|nr:DUF4255 domain-containing protein [Candidatus Scalindua japonica]GAX60150.1 hypothetical protein SCALIN_C05_0235 [Candidatus Scalindua japonica]